MERRDFLKLAVGLAAGAATLAASVIYYRLLRVPQIDLRSTRISCVTVKYQCLAC